MRILAAILAMLLLSYSLSQIPAQQRVDIAKVSKVVDESPKKTTNDKKRSDTKNKDTKNTVKNDVRDEAKEATKKKTKEKDEESSKEIPSLDDLQEDKDKKKIDLRKLSNEKLLKALNKNILGAEEEQLLVEIVRRGGKHWQGVLKKRYEALVKSQQQPAEGKEDKFDRWGLSNLHLLTALRRVHKQPDPLRILVAGKRDLSCSIGYLPDVHVLLTNLDIEKATVGITEGGHYRSGRQARWRFQVQDAKGTTFPPKEIMAMMGGGIYTTGKLKYGESWTTGLDMSDFIDINQPGKYTVTILYHNDIAIVDRDDIKGLIVCKSLPLTLTVEPIEVELTKAERIAARKAIEAIPLKGPAKILIGSYTKNVHDYIKPDSPSGKILTLDWKAVPELIDAAVSDKTNPQRRAKILALLYSITNQNDPRLGLINFGEVRGVLADYKYRDSGWRTMGGPVGSSSFSASSGEGSSTGGEIDKEKQLKFAQRWKPWIKKGFIKVIEVEEKGEE